MNEELLNELSEAMKRRDKANAAIARWTEQKTDAEEDIAELSARIAGVEAEAEAPTAPVLDSHYSYESIEYVPVPE